MFELTHPSLIIFSVVNSMFALICFSIRSLRMCFFDIQLLFTLFAFVVFFTGSLERLFSVFHFSCGIFDILVSYFHVFGWGCMFLFQFRFQGF